MAKAKPPQVYPLKITLKYIDPPIWRRVQVPDCSLYELHQIIQRCFEWDNSHLWAFTIKKETYGDGDDEFAADDFQLSEFVNRRIKKISYLYDFGDSWKHDIQIEKSLDADPLVQYPRCVAGDRTVPPEDCGGAWGYDSLVKSFENPTIGGRYEELREWFGAKFDPENFDLAAINARLAPRKPKQTQ